MKKLLPRSIITAASMLIVQSIAGPAGAETLTFSCSGGFVRTISKSQYNDPFTISSATPKNIPGARVIFQVPDGANYCLKVRFSAVGKCDAAMDQSCYVWPTMTNYSFSPAGAGYTSSPSWGAHSFEWTGRANQVGQKIIQMQASSNGGVDFDFGSWTLTVDLYE